MIINKINKDDIINALKFIDKNKIPYKNKNSKYELVADNGKTYPIKYVLAVANHMVNGSDILPEEYKELDAKTFLEDNGFIIKKNYIKYELIITSKKITSSDENFNMDNLSISQYKILDVYFQNKKGETIRRKYNKGEKINSNRTLPRISFQIYENQIKNLTHEEKENFPICKYTSEGKVVRGIFSSIEEFRKHINSIEYMLYECNDGLQFVIYCWNIFSTIIFVQECLKRFGKNEDKFVLTYCDKEEVESKDENIENNEVYSEELVKEFKGYINPYSQKLIDSKNIIFRGAPGTGKTYVAKEIATDIISEGYFTDFSKLSEEEKKQVEFVQFHPSYDYSDFVEGLRPKINEDGSMGFELKDGIFKKFIERARKNYENSQKSKETLEKEVSVQEQITNFFSNIKFDIDVFSTVTGNKFFITGVDDKYISILVPNNTSSNKLSISIDEIRRMLESGEKFEKVIDVTKFFGKTYGTQAYSYNFAIYHEIRKIKNKSLQVDVKVEKLKKYVFIIDEINRGEISKIFGELFYAIDPGYRGPIGEVSTQYSNLHVNTNKKFYIPENVYIIGTMNDIDKSVDSFDFAMRRRFRFIELKANERVEMLSLLENEQLKNEAINRMIALNNEIINVEDLNENYQIGAAYFLKLNTLTFDQLWTDCLQPLLKEYIHGIYNEDSIMSKFEKAYGYSNYNQENNNENTED